MITETQVTYEIKPMLYKIARVKNSSMWITEDKDWEQDITNFSAYKSLPFPLSMTIEEFGNTHKIITHGTFVKYIKKKEEGENNATNPETQE